MTPRPTICRPAHQGYPRPLGPVLPIEAMPDAAKWSNGALAVYNAFEPIPLLA